MIILEALILLNDGVDRIPHIMGHCSIDHLKHLVVLLQGRIQNQVCLVHQLDQQI
jgi:hypothetical protein